MSKLLNIVKMLAAASTVAATYNEPTHYYTKRNIKTKAESKKCKSCKKFGTGQCYNRYVSPMSAACNDYKSKRKK